MTVTTVDRVPAGWNSAFFGKPADDGGRLQLGVTQPALRSVGSVQIGELSGEQRVLDRSCANVSGSGKITLALLTSGRSTLHQRGRIAHLVPGDFAIVDGREPHLISFDTRFKCVLVLIDASLFPVKRHDVEDVSACRVSGHSGTGRMAAQFLLSVVQEVIDNDLSFNHDLANALVNVVSAALLEKLHEARTTEDSGELIHRIRAFIESRLDDPDLAPLDIAQANHISIRYLQRLFEAEGMTVTDWVRRQRLERCRAELCDPRHLRTTISGIAARWGFPDSSYFSRIFKAAYNETPRTVRSRTHG